MLDVTLRDLREEDKAFFAKWAQDKEFYNLITINIPNPHYKMLIKVIEHKGKPIGEVDLVNVDLENKRAGAWYSCSTSLSKQRTWNCSGKAR